MLYSSAPASRQGEPVVLYFTPDEAKAAGDGKTVVSVAVHFDAVNRRLVPVGTFLRRVDPGWSTHAERHPEGYLVARGPIPTPLFSG